MTKRLYACVYGGASDHIADKYKSQVEELGRMLADNGYSLVYGAGGEGCMGAIARGVKEKNGYVLGVSPHFIGKFEEMFPCDKTLTVDTMSERKDLMEKYGDIFLIVPGGIGTMDEFFQVLTLKYLEQISDPIVVLNLDGFYDPLLKLIDDIVAFGAAKASIRDLFDVVTAVDDEKLIALLQEIKRN